MFHQNCLLHKILFTVEYSRSYMRQCAAYILRQEVHCSKGTFLPLQVLTRDQTIGTTHKSRSIFWSGHGGKTTKKSPKKTLTVNAFISSHPPQQSSTEKNVQSFTRVGNSISLMITSREGIMTLVIKGNIAELCTSYHIKWAGTFSLIKCM